MTDLCRVIGPVRLLYNNATQFPESLAQLVGSGGGNIIGMEKFTKKIQNTCKPYISYIHFNICLYTIFCRRL